MAKWFEGPVISAITTCKESNGVLIVFAKDETTPSIEVEAALNGSEVEHALEGQTYVALAVHKDSQDYKHFTQLYPVTKVPSVFFINSVTGFPHQIVRGAISVSDLTSKIVTTFAKHAKLLANHEAQVPPSGHASQSSSSPASSLTSDPTTPVPTSGAESLSREERVRRAEEKMSQKRLEKEQEEFQNERDGELQRRSVGKDMAEAARAREKTANENLMKERRKMKEEERKARENVLAKLQRDKEDRRRAREEQESGVRQRQPTTSSSSSAQPVFASSRSTDSARLQFRVLDGSAVVQEFSSSDRLADARRFIAEKLGVAPESVTLSGTFPSRSLPTSSDQETLGQLGLSPSATIIVRSQQSGSSSGSRGGGGAMAAVWSILAGLYAAVLYVFKLLAGLFTSSRPQATTAQQQEEMHSRRKVAAERRFKQIRQEDGHFDPGDDDDDERRKTDNGNSTQQQ